MNNKMIPLVLTIVVGVILAGSVLMPIIADAQEHAGPAAEKTNTVRGVYTYNIWDGEDVTFEFTEGTPNAYAVNGETVTLTAQQNILIASNFFSMRTGGQEVNPGINYQYLGTASGAQATLSYVIEDGAYTLTIGETVLTGTLEWMVYAVADGKTGTSGLGQLTTPTSAFYTSNLNNLVVLGNVYTTGDNDTYFAYYNGDLTVNEAYADVSEVVISKTTTAGYSNIYDTTLSVKVGDETFTPYHILAPIKVAGNEANSGVSSLYGVIPVLVIVSLLVAAIGVVATRKD